MMKRLHARHDGRHYRTGEPPAPALLDRLHQTKTLFAGMGLQTQLLYATLDQRLFGRQVLCASKRIR